MVAPAGIAVNNTHTPVTRAGTESALHIAKSVTGISMRRIRLYASISLLKIVNILASARIIPITIMESPVLQLPIAVIVEVMKAGSLSWLTISISPIKQPRMHVSYDFFAGGLPVSALSVYGYARGPHHHAHWNEKNTCHGKTD
mgnify:CR=1 FL=1